MLNALESSLIVLVSMLAALGCLLAYRRYWLPRHRHQQNDIIGWHISFLATTYAVIIAFMLADVWQSYLAAQANTESEANSLLNMYRSAAALPAPPNEQVRSLAKQYATVMISEEWPAMERGGFSRSGYAIVRELWTNLRATEARNASQQAILSRALDDLTKFIEHRRIRHLANRTSIPGVFWVLLIAGAVLTIVYTCLFDLEDAMLHALQVLGTTFIITLVLVTIADVDGPYGGSLHIEPTGFVDALRSMNADAIPAGANASHSSH